MHIFGIMTDHDAELSGVNYKVGSGFIISEYIIVDRERHLTALTGRQMDTLETA